MQRVFLLIVVPAMLVALGFAQTPAASINTDQTNIRGCLGGSDGNYTVVEDNTGHIFKITTSSVDLKSHLGHEVTVFGSKADGISFAAAGNSFAITELNMTSDHCTAAAAAPIATVSTPSETASAPAAVTAATVTTSAETANAPALAAAPPAATVPTPADTASKPATADVAPAATIIAPVETAVTPAAHAAAPAETVTPPAETASAPAAPAARTTRPPAHSRKPAATATPAAAATTPAVTASTSSETDSAPAAAAGARAATVTTPAETDSAPAAAAATTPTATAKSGSLWLLILFALFVIVVGTLTPLLSKWRKRKMLERTGAPNLSFTSEASSDHGKSGQPAAVKAA
jgi:hypothetical protein